MEKITGRSDDMMIIRGVNIFPTQIEEQIFKCDTLAPHFQLELTQDQRMDVMTVNVEAKIASSDDNSRMMATKQLSDHIKNVIGISVRVNVKIPGEVERSAGKARRVIDLRKKT